MAGCQSDRENFTWWPSSSFRYMLPLDRLGAQHDSLSSFRKAVVTKKVTKEKMFTLVIVTASERRILLGKKLRGFGTGFYNSFGGKIDKEDVSPAHGAVRELAEETNIHVSLDVMQKGSIGVLRFTFDDDDVEMVVHLFRVHLKLDGSNSSLVKNILEPMENDESDEFDDFTRIEPNSIQGCDEITPIWFEDWKNIPFHEMFADDSVWLTFLLDNLEHEGFQSDVKFDGWFHFHPGGTTVNSIMHRYLKIQNRNKKTDNAMQNCIDTEAIKTNSIKQHMTMEKRLFNEIHRNDIHSPTIKEFKECWAVAKSVQTFYGKNAFDIVIDVAGGHGALGARHSTILDPAEVGQGGVEKAWKKYYDGKTLFFRHECLRTGLKDEIMDAIVHRGVDHRRILVVACHACQHLSEETCEIATNMGVHVAVMPCCQADKGPRSGSWKALSKNMKMPFAPIMDILLAGKIMAWGTGKEASSSYHVRMKLIDSNITPQNRLILCKSMNQDERNNTETKDLAHKRLETIYIKAHQNAAETQNQTRIIFEKNKNEDDDSSHVKSKLTKRYIGFDTFTNVTTGFLLGCLASFIFLKHK